MERKYALIRTLPKKERAVARDLCDCLYYYDSEVKCEVVTTGIIYVYSYSEYLKKCINSIYFEKLIRSLELFDEISKEKPVCNCEVVEIGGVYFLRFGAKR